MTESERRAQADVFASADCDAVQMAWEEGPAETAAEPMWERAGRDPFFDARPGVDFPPGDGAEERGADGGLEEMTFGSDVAREADPDSARRRVNQSLARLEMNTLEVKLFLDSIDQRISRMEPRLEQRQVEAPPAPAVTEEAKTPPAVEAPTGESMAVEALTSEAGGEQRRRRADRVEEEARRSRYPRPLAAAVDEEHGWAWRPWLERLRRPGWQVWVAGGVLSAALLGTLIAWSTGHPERDSRGRPGIEAVQVAAPGAAKPSADVSTGASSGPAGGGSYSLAQKSTAGQTDAPGGRSVADGASLTGLVGADTAPISSGPVSGSAGETSELTADANEPVPPAEAASRTAVTGRAGAPAMSRVHVSSGVMAGNLLSSKPPVYPKGLAGLFHTEGRVVMQVIVAKNGRVENVHVISGHHMLRGAAKDAVRTWRYRPYSVNGYPVEVATIVSVEFHR